MFLGLIRTYQVVVSPLLGTRCRFHPTCSSYMAQAIQEHGTVAGCWLGLKRLVRCHPWADGGHDPVPSCSEHAALHAQCNTKTES